MKNTIKKAGLFIAAGIVAVGMYSCTDLDEKIYSDLYKDNFYKNRLEVMQGALRPFTHMQAWLSPDGGDRYYYHAEMSADQLAWPQKGRHGYDGGDHFRQHYHTWDARESRGRGMWNMMWTGTGFVNSAIGDLKDIDGPSVGMTAEEMEVVMAELYVLRAFHYMKAMEMWGNIPIVETVGEPKNPTQSSRKEVFEYCKTQLEQYVPALSPYSTELIGRISQTAGYAMLADLYLNAEYFVGTPMYDECIAACNKIINGEAGGLGAGNRPELASDLLSTFSTKNQQAVEALFQFAYSNKGGFRMNIHDLYIGYDNMRDAMNVTNGGWNAFVVIPTAFDAYQDNDLRKKEWFLFGQQYYVADDPAGSWKAGDMVLGTEEFSGRPFAYVNSIRHESTGDFTSEGGMDQGEENSGARFNKYRIGQKTDPDYYENHYMMYRLTEIYFFKAEALMRKNGGTATQEAVDLINACRQRCFAPEDWDANKYTTATLTMDELLAERGREFIFEAKRRMDLIRFNKFVTTDWWDHKASNDHNREIYPIPQTQMDMNPNLVQNPGYN